MAHLCFSQSIILTTSFREKLFDSFGKLNSSKLQHILSFPFVQKLPLQWGSCVFWFFFPPESLPGDLRLHKDTESLSLEDEVGTGSTIIQQKTCSYVSPLLDGILRGRKMKNGATPCMYTSLDLFHTTNSHMQNRNTGAFTAHANTYPGPPFHPPTN